MQVLHSPSHTIGARVRVCRTYGRLMQTCAFAGSELRRRWVATHTYIPSFKQRAEQVGGSCLHMADSLMEVGAALQHILHGHGRD